MAGLSEYMGKKPKKPSLLFQLMAMMLVLVAGTHGVCWMINLTVLESYYVYNKQKDILAGYEIINQADYGGFLEEDSFDISFERMCANGNFQVLVIAQDGTVLRTTYNKVQIFELQIQELLGTYAESGDVLKENKNYVIQRKTDRRMQSEFVRLTGQLSTGNYIQIQTPLQSIQEGVDIANRFFMMVGSALLVVCCGFIFWIARGISYPIMELTEISRRMTNLDFEVKYPSGLARSEEIDSLGIHMNELSNALERTISELKSANNELMKDIERKEQIDEMRKEFLSNVSHELKTPLALIQGYAEGLMDNIDEDDRESRNFYCEVIVDEANKMNQMVKKLLSLNQLEFGNDFVELSRFDLTELVNGVISASSILLQSEQITVVFEERKPVYVWGDEFKVEEVITNFFSNAIHHAKGEKIIRITFQVLDGKLRTSVFNTGDPIPEESLDKVWIKFYKVDKARTREYGGSGIGLSIVKAIMNSFHQECGVCNHPDGVEFWMELDCKDKQG